MSISLYQGTFTLIISKGKVKIARCTPDTIEEIPWEELVDLLGYHTADQVNCPIFHMMVEENKAVYLLPAANKEVIADENIPKMMRESFEIV